MSNNKRFVVGISGASGVIYGIRLLEMMKQQGLETHVILTPAAKITIASETDYSPTQVEKLASASYKFNDIAAAISSGSYQTDGMILIPCSMHTLGALASGIADNLLIRAAEVTMKEHRPMIIVPRETPVTLIHLENMARLARAGALIVPAMPAFYHSPKNLNDIIDHLVGKIFDLLKLENSMFKRWEGPLGSKE